MDAVGTNIRLDTRMREVMRALPRLNEDVNEEWAHDKTRHCVDGLLRRRLDRPWIRRDGKLAEASWEEAFALIADKLAGAGPDQVGAIAGDLQDLESVFAMKALLKNFGSSLHECRQDGALFDVSHPAAYRFNSTIAGIEDASAILIVGSNVRWEAPLVNTRIRKAVKRGAKVFAIGPEVDLTYPATWLGDDLSLLAKLPDSVTEAFGGEGGKAVIVGMGALQVPGAHQGARAAATALGATFNMVHTAASRVGALDLGFVTEGGIEALKAKAGSLKALFLLGADELDLSAFTGTFTIYIGSHGDAGARSADVILPGAAYSEKHGTYVNLEGRVQLSERATHPPGDARTDWSILRALSDVLGRPLPFDDLGQLRAAIAAEQAHLTVPGLSDLGAPPAGPKAPKLSGGIAYPIADFYLTNPIARSSPTLRRCSAELLHGETFLEAAE
jgi:NADH-quinone oxidoreductase subunit G